MKKLKPIVISGLLVTFLFSSYVAIAAEYGSKDDPLVSLSYIEDVLLPKIESDVNSKIASTNSNYIKEVDSAIEALEGEYSSYASNADFIQKVADKIDSSKSTVLNLTKGSTIKVDAGTEILLRSGNLTCVTSSFLNVTSAEVLLENGSFVKNNLYISIDHDQKITVSEDATLIVFGDYVLG